jgi:hypothetical protein
VPNKTDETSRESRRNKKASGFVRDKSLWTVFVSRNGGPRPSLAEPLQNDSTRLPVAGHGTRVRAPFFGDLSEMQRHHVP